jgi:glycosyltransferase involved in cell wall biosynthesis
VSPQVSVVVPTYQNRSTIAATVASVLAQTYRDFELVVADHSSTDGTLEEARRSTSDSRVRFLTTPAGGGAERNWNRVTDEARGTYLKLVCGDDLIYPTCLARQAEALDAHPSAGIVSAKRDLIDPSGHVLLRARGLGRLDGLVAGPEAVHATVRAGANLLGEPMCNLMRTELVRKVGGWSAAHPFLIDEDMYVKVLRHSDLVAIREPLAAFRVSNSQWSVRLAAEQARQAAAFHAVVRRDFPESVSAWDARLGTAHALRTAWLRRAAYLVWRRRMQTAPA